jgi:putative SOS response-associated peptidase YedK
MCNLYSLTKGQAAIRKLARAMRDHTGNLPPLPGIFPDQMAPIIRTGEDGERELLMMRWGFPSPPVFGSPRPVTNVRNVNSNYWKPWLSPEQRCLVPATSFCEYRDKADPKTKRKMPVWFALSEKRPLFFFAGIWRSLKGTRGTKAEPVEGEHLLFSFLTTDSNKDVKPIHAKAMPVILAGSEEADAWLTAPVEKALKLQRPLPAGMLEIVATVEKKDAA